MKANEVQALIPSLSRGAASYVADTFSRYEAFLTLIEQRGGAVENPEAIAAQLTHATMLDALAVEVSAAIEKVADQ